MPEVEVMSVMRYDLVIFDFDGTLADSTAWMMSTLNVMARRHGFREIGPTEMDRLRALPTREVIRALKVSPWRLPFIAADMRRQSAADAASISLFPEAADVLQELTDLGVTLAVVSSNGEQTVRAVLGKAQDLVDLYECEASLFGKASKLRKVMQRLAIGTNRTLYVGDETRDIDAAFRAHLPAAAATWGYGHRNALEARRPAYLLDRFSDLLRVAANQRHNLRVVPE